MITINRDFVDWPLDTFIDAYGFARVRPFDAPPCFSDGATPVDLVAERIEAIDHAGIISEGLTSEMYWGDKIAWRALDIPGLPSICVHCGAIDAEGRMNWVDEMGGLMCDACYCEGE